MKWSLFDEKNNELLDAIKRIHNISDERLRQAKKTIEDAHSLLGAMADAGSQSSTEPKQHAKSRIAIIKSEVLAAAQRVQKGYPAPNVFVTLPDPHRNNRMFAFSISNTNKYGKIKLEQVAIANPEDFSAKDLVTIERNKKIKVFKTRRKKILAAKEKIEHKRRKKTEKKSDAALPIAKKIAYEA